MRTSAEMSRGRCCFSPVKSRNIAEIEVGPRLLEPAICDFSCKGTPAGGLRNHGLLRPVEVPMTMHGDHHITDAEDAAFDATIKIMGVVMVLVVIAGMAAWYIYS